MEDSILLSYFDGKLDEAECSRVEAWAAQNEENRKRMEQIYYMRELTERCRAYGNADLEGAMERFRRRTARESSATRVQAGWWRSHGRQIAAFLTGVVLMSGVLLALLLTENSYEVSTLEGQRAQVALPDGSQVWLNQATRLTYQAARIGTRRVNLEGEAYFEVRHNDHRPFVVEAQKGVRTRVLGTKFNVRSREVEKRVITTLFEGAVRMFRNAGDETGHRMKPGQTLTVDTETGRMELRTYNRPEEMLCWIKGEMRFEGRTLWEIAQCLEKVYGIRVAFGRQELMKERFTCLFKTDAPVEEVLRTLALTKHFAYRIEGNRITIY